MVAIAIEENKTISPIGNTILLLFFKLKISTTPITAAKYNIVILKKMPITAYSIKNTSSLSIKSATSILLIVLSNGNGARIKRSTPNAAILKTIVIAMFTPLKTIPPMHTRFAFFGSFK